MPSSKFSSSRSAGLVIAGAVALLLSGIVLFIALRHKPPAKAPAIAGEVTDIDAAPLPQVPTDGSTVPGRDGRWQFTRKDDPNRLQAEVLYRRMNPLGPGAYSLDEPRAWIYLEDGRALFVRANSGKIKGQANSQQAESGEFSGDVVILLFPPRTGDMDRTPRDPMADAPVMVARTSAIRFDTMLLEFATDDAFQIESPDLRFEGTGLMVRGNQVLDRIEYLNVSKDGLLRYRVEQSPTDRQRDEGWESPAVEATAQAPVAPAEPRTVPPPTPAAPADSAPSVAASIPSLAADQTTDSPAPLTDSAASTAPNSVPPAVAHVQPPAPPAAHARLKEDLYRAVFAGDVRLMQKRRLLTSDSLLVWIRTLDNKLPIDTFGPEAAPAAPAPTAHHHTAPACGGATLHTFAAIPALLLGARDWPPRLFADGPADMELTWTGALTVRPLATDSPPRELADDNHLALRFTSIATGGDDMVRLADASMDARGACEELEYLATRRVLTLTSGVGSPTVWLAAPQSGCLVGPSVSVNMLTGAAEIPGGGLLATLVESTRNKAMAPDDRGLPAFLSAPDTDWLSRRITWVDRADFKFRVADGEVRDALESADFYGRASAQDEQSSLAGDAVRIDFIEHGDEPMLLSRLRVDGEVEALAEGWQRPPGVDVLLVGPDFGQGVLHAASLDVKFEPSKLRPRESEPTYLIARGEAAAGRGDSLVQAPILEAWLTRDDSGDIAITDFEARANPDPAGQDPVDLAKFRRADGIRASAQRIRGNAQLQTAALTGPHVQVARGESVINSTIVELDGLKGTMAVFAPGTFAHEQPTRALTGPAAGTTRVTAEWTRSMLFDDLAGRLDCHGDTVVILTEPLETDTIRAQRVRIDLSTTQSAAAPAAVAGGESPNATASSNENTSVVVGSRGDEGLAGDRRLLRATAYGALNDEPLDPAPLATVESRKYAAAASGTPADRVLETISYIESTTLIADDEKGTFAAPASGRVIVYDQRAAESAAQPPLAPVPAAADGPLASPRGTSSFRWAQSMLFTRATGELQLEREVEVVHKPIEAGPITRMTSDTLIAVLDLTGGGSQLVSANAKGSVYAESGTQRLVAADVAYDVRAGSLIAAAAPGDSGGTVTLFDDRRATPMTARKLRWDLLRDEVEILEPAMIVAPR